MQFVFEQIPTGGNRNLAYVVGDRTAKVAAVIDPAFEPRAVVERCTAQGLKVAYIVNTHGHPDHTGGNAEAKRLTGAPVAAFKESPARPDVTIEDGQELAIGALKLRFLHTPGHCPDHLVVHIPELDAAITGDILFVGKVGGTESDDLARVEYRSLERVLGELPGHTTIWPGHDFGARPSSTIVLERKTNPFLLAGGVEEFLELKRRWPEFKMTHGLR